MIQQDASFSTLAAALTVDAIMARSGVQFGTSGARGQVVAMTDQVCHAYTTGFLQHLADLGEFAPERGWPSRAICGPARRASWLLCTGCARSWG
jgi:phosphomannomutase